MFTLKGVIQTVDKKKKKKFLIVWAAVLVVLLVLIFLMGKPAANTETLQDVMKDGVLHDHNKIKALGMLMNPSVIADWWIMGILLGAAALIRIFAVPHFTEVPGKFQLALESLVDLADGLARQNSPHRHEFLGAYVFFAGSYIFFGTLFELFGIQAITTTGASVSLPSPLSDINAAIALGCLSYGVIMSGGIAGNHVKGIGLTLKEFSLPISMSFRLFGALLSGLLVTELVYYSISLSFVIPVAVGIMFTLMHALIQTYVLTMLTTVFYGEVSLPQPKKAKKSKAKPKAADIAA